MLIGVISRCTTPPPAPPSPLFLASFKKGLPLLFSLAKKKIYLDTLLKEELTDLF